MGTNDAARYATTTIQAFQSPNSKSGRGDMGPSAVGLRYPLMVIDAEPSE
jgi:hypothetical protein